MAIPSPRVFVALGVSVCVLLAALVFGGCTVLKLREQRKMADSVSRLRGTVRTAYPSSHPLIVVLIRLDVEEPSIVDHYVVSEAGRFRFNVLPGATYALAAFEDRDENGIYEDEPALRATEGPQYRPKPGERIEDIDLVIPLEGRASVEGPMDIAALQARSAQDQERVTIGQLVLPRGVVRPDDPRFTSENGDKGLWWRTNFLWDDLAGIYFLEECSAEKTPVLFVHGIKGHPREFEALIANLDRERLQPWLFFYPSGSGLLDLGKALSQQVIQLQLRCGFDELFVVAHSMGGLVARAFVLEHYATTRRDQIRLFVSISTPWGGMASARSMYHAPEGIQALLPKSFLDVAVGSAFINGLFFEDPEERKRLRLLPDHLSYHLMFGVWADEIVPEASASRWEVVREADEVFPLYYGHTEILREPETSAALNRVLARN